MKSSVDFAKHDVTRSTPRRSLKERADDVLIAVAILGLVATISDGEPDLCEIDQFTDAFQHRFALSKKAKLRIISIALQRIKEYEQKDIIQEACDTLNHYLTTEQKVNCFDGLAEVLVADGAIHEGEEYFLEYVAKKLEITNFIEDRLLMA